MLDQAAPVAVLTRPSRRPGSRVRRAFTEGRQLGANGREIGVGAVAMGSDGAFGEVERVVGELVICRLFTGCDRPGPVTAGYRHSEVTVIHEPADVLTAGERAALLGI